MTRLMKVEVTFELDGKRMTATITPAQDLSVMTVIGPEGGIAYVGYGPNVHILTEEIAAIMND